MNLWTKAVILLIVTNSMASSDQNQSSQKTTTLSRIPKGVFVPKDCYNNNKKYFNSFIECIEAKWRDWAGHTKKNVLL